jgi:uncharacterized protein (TIGR02147 family)
MNGEIFEYDSYKKYLNEWLDDPSLGGGRGSRTRLSKAIGCQTAYAAQVLKGAAHFSLEQAEAINDFLGHSDEQGNFLLLLIQRERAGSKNLRVRFDRQIKSIRENRLLLMNRLRVSQPLGQKDQVIYYSSWYYAAIHALASIPGFQTPLEISKYLQMDPKKTQEAIEFLVGSGLLAYDPKTQKLGVGRESIHLGVDSPLISKHHINWRLQAIRALERSGPDNLHYSSVISISNEDAQTIREVLVKAIERIKPMVKKSKEEVLKSFSLDFFGI